MICKRARIMEMAGMTSMSKYRFAFPEMLKGVISGFVADSAEKTLKMLDFVYTKRVS